MIAFLGQGRMGVPMARRLAGAGHDVTTWRRGAELLPVVEGADVVITMLSDPAAVLEVLTAARPGLRPGCTVIEMSTIGPEAVAELRALLPDSVRLVDAPVLGSVQPAAGGTLTVLAGGDLTGVRDILSVFGDVREVGPLGTGAAMKLAVMSVLLPAQVLVAEALAGVPDPEALLDVLAATPLGGIADRLRQPAADTRFSLALAAKDLRLAVRPADTLAAAALRRLEEAESAGYGPRDVTSIAPYLAAHSSPPAGTPEGSGDVPHGLGVAPVGSGAAPLPSGDDAEPTTTPHLEPLNPPDIPATNGFYSHAVRTGQTLYISGQAAFDENGKVVGEGDMGVQAEVVFSNIAKILASQGAGFEDVAFIRTYLTDMDDRAAYGAVRRRYITGPPPASTTVEVSRLFMPGLLLEVDVIATLPTQPA
ncbi:Rid family hydrolase [Nonomuraea sp. NPDC050328]|uniref:Rid family hydrolase n=1 Tax=Nonomuraea sp. NPDC050328 TaxID=3364361 RepID=UPI00378D0E61